MNTRPRSLVRILEPRSIAVVGASADAKKRGHQIFRGLMESRYNGDLHAVNPVGGFLLEHPVLSSVDELPEGVDLAVLCTRSALAPDLVRACGRRGVAGVVVLAVGFGEAGRRGAELEAELAHVAREGGVRLIGPNTSGLLNLHLGVNLIGTRGIRAGDIALLVQSGNVALSWMKEINARSSLGVSVCCGLGNEVDVGYGEVLEFLGEHGDTRAVMVHVEGCRDARGFLRAAAGVARVKPVIVLKGGRTTDGARAALSHTGSVAGPYPRFQAGMVQAGAIEVSRTDEVLDVAQTLATQASGLRVGGGIAILSDGGGQNTLAVDVLKELGAELAVLDAATSAKLRELLGASAATKNPVDVAGAADRDPGVFARALDILALDPAVGIVLVVGLFGGYGIRFHRDLAATEEQAARSMARTMRAGDKGLVVQSIYASHRGAPLEALRECRVPLIESLEVACRAVTELQRWNKRAHGSAAWLVDEQQQHCEPPPMDPAVGAARMDDRVTLTEWEARDLLSRQGLALGSAQVVNSPAQAAQALDGADGAIALKLLSRHITHKSDAGGVRLNLKTGADAAEAFGEIQASAGRWARAHGLPPEEYRVLASPMLAPPLAELLVGAVDDAQLGPVLTIGAGGVWVEALDDTAHRVLPLGAADLEAVIEKMVQEMLAEVRVGVRLAGGRGYPGARVEDIVAAARAVARCVIIWDDLKEVEINPLFVYADRAVPVDARAVLRDL